MKRKIPVCCPNCNHKFEAPASASGQILLLMDELKRPIRVRDLLEVFPRISRNHVAVRLNQLFQQGYIERVGYGMYKLKGVNYD